MPRIPRGQLVGHAFHLLNRGNARATVFDNDADYRAVITLLAKAKERTPVRVAAFSVLPNHLHLVAEPQDCRALSRFMQWWFTSHVRRYHRVRGTSGHVWQGRFKSFPIQADAHFLTVVRYVLQNPVRAGLVTRPGEWPWSSLAYPELVDPWPVPAPRDALWIEEPLPQSTLDSLRVCVRRQAPFGTTAWQRALAVLLGLEPTLRPRGRPRKRGQAGLTPSDALEINTLPTEK
jgi:putative transposase